MYGSIRVGKSVETESRLVVGKEDGNDCLMGIWFWIRGSFSGGKNVLELDVSDGCTTS